MIDDFICIMQKVRKDLEQRQRKPDTPEDKIYRENLLDKGIDKYQTLKKIREGTGEFNKRVTFRYLYSIHLVKRRIDEFEAMQTNISFCSFYCH